MIMEQNLLQGEKNLKVFWGLTMFLKSYLFDEAWEGINHALQTIQSHIL